MNATVLGFASLCLPPRGWLLRTESLGQRAGYWFKKLFCSFFVSMCPCSSQLVLQRKCELWTIPPPVSCMTLTLLFLKNSSSGSCVWTLGPSLRWNLAIWAKEAYCRGGGPEGSVLDHRGRQRVEKEVGLSLGTRPPQLSWHWRPGL